MARHICKRKWKNYKNLPLTEGGSVDDNDGVLDKGLGPDDIHDHVLGIEYKEVFHDVAIKKHVQAPDKLVVASIVDDVDDPGLASSCLRGPGKVASVQPGQIYMIKFFTFFPILGVVHLSALYFLLPPLVLRVWILWGASLVIAGGRANSNFLFFLKRSKFKIN